MKNVTKFLLVGASVISMAALSACQSTQAVGEQGNAPHKMKDQKEPRQHAGDQRKHSEHKRGEHMQAKKAFDKACDGKAVGSATEISIGDKTIKGQCQIVFSPERPQNQDRKQKRDGDYQKLQGFDKQRGEDKQRGDRPTQAEPLTDAKRAELVQQYNQKLAFKQAQQQAFSTACKGQPAGQAVQLKVGEQQINGRCSVRFMPTAPAAA